MTENEANQIGNALFDGLASGREIGAAIMAADRAARQECAEIAQKHGKNIHTESDCGYNYACEDIAAKIRASIGGE